MNGWMRILAGCLPALLLLAAGCMYPEERRLQTDRLPEHVAMVQSAADQYWEQNRRFPIKEDPGRAKASPYEKYVVDFSKLEGYIGQIPPSAFEMGGHFLYVLVVSENKMQVRLVDLRVADRLRDLQVAVDAFRDKETAPHRRIRGGGLLCRRFSGDGVGGGKNPEPLHGGIVAAAGDGPTRKAVRGLPAGNFAPVAGRKTEKG